MERLAKPSRPFMHDNDHRGFFNVQHRPLESHTLVRGGDTSTKATPFPLGSYVITLDLKPRVGSESLGANCVLSHPSTQYTQRYQYHHQRRYHHHHHLTIIINITTIIVIIITINKLCTIQPACPECSVHPTSKGAEGGATNATNQ